MFRAVTSASNIHRRLLCPGSEKLEAGLPDEDSIQSKEGDLLHAYDANPDLVRAVLKPNQQNLLRISEELDEIIFDLTREKFSITESEPFEEGRETTLIAMEGTDSETPGHCDRWRLYPALSLLIIIDKKFGFKEVTPASSNPQLRTYAIGGYEKWAPENIVVAITQPRLEYERRLTMACYTAKDIEFARAELSSIRAASRRDDAPLVPGEEQCRYCKAKLICKAYRAKVQEGMEIIPRVEGSVAKREESAAQSLALCTDDQLSHVLVAIKFAEFLKDAAREEGRKRVAAGRLTNWEVGKEKETNTITSPRIAIGLLAMGKFMTREEILDCSMEMHLGPIIEKHREKMMAQGKKCTWKDAKEQVHEALS